MEPSGSRTRAREVLLSARKQNKLLHSRSRTNPLTHPDSKSFYVQARSLIEYLARKGVLQNLIDDLPRLRGTIHFDDIFHRNIHQSVDKFFADWKTWVEGLKEN